MIASEGIVVKVYDVVNASSLNHPAKLYPLRVGLVGAETAVPGWAVIALTAVP